MSKALLALAGIAVALLALEIGLRLHPPVDLPLNDPYQLTRLVGTRQFRTPFHTYREIYPVQFDHDGYYQRSDGAIDYHFDQDGGRWIEPRARDLQGDVAHRRRRFVHVGLRRSLRGRLRVPHRTGAA